MSRKRSILEELTIDELRAKFDDYELEVDDRRVRAQLIDASARSRKVRIADILYQMSRDRLKQLCRAIGLGDTGRGKAELVGRLTGSAGAPEEPPRPSTKPPTESPSLEAALLLKNLLARLDADALGERPLFRSVVSDAEREALRALLGSAGSPPLSPSTEPTKPIERVETPLPAVELNTDALRLDASPEPAWVLCLDFGTAKSKAFAATGDEEEPGLEPLAVGQADNDLDGSVHEVSSCVWIDDDGQLFVGSEAVNRGMSYGGEPATRRPLDSLKQEISQVDPEEGAAELARKLPRDVDPTSTLTYADAITIYLAYLTDLATTALESRLGTRYVRRRFTVPSWRRTQRRWAADLIGKSLLRAQLLADTFHGRWGEGIHVEQVARAVRAAAGHDPKLTWMAATESDDVTDWRHGTLEALAAASARLWNDGSARDVMLVVDVGAGTTDLSLFWVVQRDAEFHRAWPIEGGDPSPVTPREAAAGGAGSRSLARRRARAAAPRDRRRGVRRSAVPREDRRG